MLLDGSLKVVMELTGFRLDLLPLVNSQVGSLNSRGHSPLDSIQLDDVVGSDQNLLPLSCSWALGWPNLKEVSARYKRGGDCIKECGYHRSAVWLLC